MIALPETAMSAEENSAMHLLAQKIDSSGPIPLGEYMGIANAAYYAAKDPLGKDGDFVTAPEISQIFGELIGIWLSDLWLRAGKNDHCHYVELGPGRGTLASDALRVMSKFECTPMVHFVENSPVLKAAQAERHNSAIWHDHVDSLPDDGPLLIVANEFFDALPIEQFVMTQAGWRQHMVARERAKFVAIPGLKNMQERMPPAKDAFPAGTIIESSPTTVDILNTLADRVSRQGGVILIIDYGYDKPGTGNTLQAVKDHMPVSPFDSPGTSDLTAHVNFHNLANVLRTRLLSTFGPVGQGQWLKALGADQRAEILAKAKPKQTEAIEAAKRRLMDAEEMGSLFKVMATTAMSWPEPEGFVYKDEDE